MNEKEKWKIPNPVKLKFDPEKSENNSIREIFDNPFTKTLWLGIKRTHKIKKGFNSRCAFLASQYNKGKIEIKSLEGLGGIIDNFLVEFIDKPKYLSSNGTKYDKSLTEELYYYLMDEELTYVVSSEKELRSH